MTRRTISRIEHGGRIALHFFDPSESGRPHSVVDRRVGGGAKEETYADLASAEEHYGRLEKEIRAAMPKNVGGAGVPKSAGSFGRRGGSIVPAPRTASAPASVSPAETPFLEFRMRGDLYDAFATVGGHDAPLVEGLPLDVLPTIRARVVELQRSGVLERVHFSDAALATVRAEMRTLVEALDAGPDAPASGPRF